MMRNILILFFLVIVIASYAYAGQDKETSYSLEWIVPSKLVCIEGKTMDRVVVQKNWHLFSFLGGLTAGVREISKEFNICSLTPITANHDDGGVTQALLVFVESR